MNPKTLLGPLFLACAGLLALVPTLVAGLPQPMCVYYGQALDGYGWPYRTNAEVVLLRGSTEVARQTIRGSISPGVNFALYVHLDDGRTAVPYSARALRSGELVSLVVRDSEGQKPIMENATVPPVGQPGELVLVNVTAATDLDGDGLPDRWEEEMIAWSGGALHSIYDVRGSDDFDGDGLTNLQEYRAGTFAFLDYDYLMIDWLARTPGNRLRMTFLSVPGKIYSVHGTTNLTETLWELSPFALSEAGPLALTPAEGNGGWISLYLPVEESSRFLRLEVR
jgi:hypothetical protein